MALATKDDPSLLNLDLAEGLAVLAMYPDTTTFYPAHVVRPASKDHHQGRLDPGSWQGDRQYLILFEDDEGVHRPIPAKFVIVPPEKS